MRSMHYFVEPPPIQVITVRNTDLVASVERA
jgi:hypothetical protein